MRQTIHKVVTVAAALLMSCALPYSTRANLDNTYGPNVADGRANSDMPAAESVKFLAFPRELDAVQAEHRLVYGRLIESVCLNARQY